ncbi:hypothetical protein [Nostocoides japonicum]|nr:hypothetical protein [Tetrasphaera japonica]
MSSSRAVVWARISRAREERRMLDDLRSVSPSMRMDLTEALRRSATR